MLAELVAKIRWCVVHRSASCSKIVASHVFLLFLSWRQVLLSLLVSLSSCILVVLGNVSGALLMLQVSSLFQLLSTRLRLWTNLCLIACFASILFGQATMAVAPFVLSGCFKGPDLDLLTLPRIN